MKASSALESLAPIERTETLGKRVRDELRAAIMAGRFTPGQKLAIRAVASALDVSMTPAREALYALASEGVLEMRASGSVHVPDLGEADIAELTKIRAALEGLAAREAAGRMSEREIAETEALNERLIEADARGDYEKLIRLNWQFHFAIYRASGMPHLVRMIEGCWLMTGSYLNIIYPEFGSMDTGIRNHREIAAALKARDAGRLSRAVVADIDFAAGALLAQIRTARSE